VARSFKYFGLVVALFAVVVWLRRPQRQDYVAVSPHPELPVVRVQPPSMSRVAGSGGALSGAVRSEQGQPIAGAVVCVSDVATRRLGAMSARCESTSHTGEYRLTELGVGVYEVTVSADGYRPAVDDPQRNVVMRTATELTDVDFVLARGGARLTGLIVDATGGVVQAARVTASFGEPARLIQTHSDAEGRFVFWLDEGRVFVYATADGYTPSFAGHVAPSSDLTLRMTPSASIQGMVVAADTGAPVSGVEVRAYCSHCIASAASPFGVSSDTGKFVISGLDPDSYALLAEGDGWRGEGRSPVRVGLADVVRDMVVHVGPVARVEGVVSRAQGEPCLRGVVSLGPPEAGPSVFDPPTNAAGEVSTETGERAFKVPTLTAGINDAGAVHFPAVPSGTYHVSVHCEDHLLSTGPTTLQVGVKDVSDLKWQVSPGLKLIAHVVDDTGKPLPGTDFSLAWPARNATQPPTSMMFTSDANGRYELQSHLYPGDYVLSPYNGHEGEPVTVSVRAGERPAEGTLRLKGRGAIHVTVTGSGGTPIDTLRVTAISHDEPTPENLTARHKMMRGVGELEGIPRGRGLFQVGPLRPGTYDLAIDDGVNTPLVKVVQVDSTISHHTVRLDLDQTLRGRVVDAKGQAQPDVWVSVTCSPELNAAAEEPAWRGPIKMLHESKRIVSDAEGTFQVTGIARTAQSCVVRADDSEGASGILTGARLGKTVTVTLQDPGLAAAPPENQDEKTPRAL
jgi:hypothetical protein